MRIPNREVQISFNEMLLDLLTGNTFHIQDRSNLYQRLAGRDLEGLRQQLIALYAGIPYQHFTTSGAGKPMYHYEGYYASVFYAAIASLGLTIIPEESSNRGRADFTVFAGKTIYIFEFKLAKNEEPLQQIKEQRYFEKYLAEKREIVLVGIVFDEQERNISQMLWETLRGR